MWVESGGIWVLCGVKSRETLVPCGTNLSLNRHHEEASYMGMVGIWESAPWETWLIREHILASGVRGQS